MRALTVFVSVLVATTVAAACGGGDDSDEAPEESTSSTTTTTTTVSADDDDGAAAIVPLTGEPLDENDPPAARALVVKIGNNDDRARPQAGLAEADLVYEEMIEGLKTRLAAVFHSEIPERIGPVRSGRSSDLDLTSDLGQPYVAYSGGNQTVLDEFGAGVDEGRFIDAGIIATEAPYERDSSRSAPDNLYFFFADLEQADGESPPPRLFDYESPAGPVADDEGDGIVVRYPTSFGRESVHVWDADLDGWVRIQDGTIHSAEVDGAQVEIAPTNVVVLETVYIDSPADAASPQAVTFGSGRAWVLVDGRVIDGEWERNPDEPGFRFTDGDGDPIGLRPGSTWVLLANDGSGSTRFGVAETEVLGPDDAAAMLADARELAAGNGTASP